MRHRVTHLWAVDVYTSLMYLTTDTVRNIVSQDKMFGLTNSVAHRQAIQCKYCATQHFKETGPNFITN